MADEIKLIINTILDDKNYQAGIKKMENSTKTSEKTIGSAINNIKLGYVAVAGAIAGVIKIAGAMIDEAVKQEKADIALAQALKSVGEFSGEAFNEMKSFASQMQDTTGIADDQIQMLMKQGFAMGISKDKMQEAVKGAIGLSNALGIDLNTALKMTAGALGGEYSMLSRYIPALRTATSDAEKMAIIQRVMGQGYETTKKQMETYSGVMTDIKNIMGDYAEVGGKVIMNVLTPFVTMFRNLIKPKKDIKQVTAELIEKYKEYKEVSDKLADSTRKLSKEERTTLEIKQAQLKLDTATLIEKSNKLYSEQSKKVKEAREVQREYNSEFNELEMIIQRAIKSGNDYIALTGRQTGIIQASAEEQDKQGRWLVKTTDALNGYNEANTTSQKVTKKTTEAQSDLNNLLNQLALNYKIGLATDLQLAALQPELAAQIRERSLSVKELTGAETDRQIATQENIKIKDEYLKNSLQAEIDAEWDKYQQLLAIDGISKDERMRIKEEWAARSQIIAEKALKAGITSEQELSKITKTELLKRIKDYEDTEKAKKLIADTFVDGFLSGLQDMKSSSRDVLVSMIKQFVTMIAGKLAALSALYFAQLNIPAGIATLAAAGTVKVLGNTAANQVASFAGGAENLPYNQFAQLHKGERIVPAQYNIPGLSNLNFAAAAMRGLQMPLNAGGGNTYNQQRETNETNQYGQNTVNLQLEGVGLDDILGMAERMNARIMRR